jgi:hypothetical protein
MLLLVGTQLLGFALGVAACFVFWYLLVRVKPDVRIASVAAHNFRKGLIGIKIINYSRRQATDVKAHLSVSTKPPVGVISTRVIGRLRWDHLLALDPKQNLDGLWTLPTTFIFVCENGNEMLAELDKLRKDGTEARLVFTITAQDSVSGTTIVRRVTYRRRDIVDGWYKPRLSFNVEPKALAAEELLRSESRQERPTT